MTELREGSIRGTVTAEGGPASDAWLVASRGEIQSLARDWEVGPILADVDGSFTLDGLGEGSWAVRAFRADGGEASVGGVELGSDITLDLAANGSVAGRVHLPDGSAPTYFEIEMRAKIGKSRRQASFYRSDGAFELAGLAAGDWQLEVRSESGSASLAIELAAGQDIADLDVELEPRVTITGRAVDSRSGEPVDSVEIGLQQGGFGRRVRPSEDGGFELACVPPGRVQLVITPRDLRTGSVRFQFWYVDVEPEPSVQDIGEVPLAGRERGPGEIAGTLGFELTIVGFSGNGSTIDEQHVEVSKITAGGPAAAAGLRVGDVITSFDGASVEGRRAMHAHQYMKVTAKDSVTLVRSDGSELTIVAVSAGQ